MAESGERDLSGRPGRSRSRGYLPIYNKSYAIVVGIDTYKDPNLRPLGNAEADARSINDVLSTKPYEFQVELLLGENATRRSITQALNKIRQISQADDRVIFYFAGHGYVVPNNRGYDIGYLACADTDPDDPFDGLKFEEVISFAHFAEAKHIAFILDACFSGNALGLTRAAIQAAPEREYLFHTAYQILTAGGSEVVSDARSMSGELVKVLREGSSRTKNFIDLQSFRAAYP